jgi:serine/threonine protein phosphatase 1
MATFVVGDIHGNATALGTLLVSIEKELSGEDTIVFLGDYIDRGPHSRGCVEQILRLRDRTPATVVTLLGNHEQWMLRTLRDFGRHSWLLGMEALETIRSYSEQAALRLRDATHRAGPRIVTETVLLPYEDFFDAMPRSHLGFFEGLSIWYRSPDALCVHGGVSLDGTPIEEQAEDAVVWGPDEFPEQYQGRELVVYGHRGDTPLGADGRPKPRVRRNTIGLDSSEYGVLTAVRLPDQRVFQARG